MAQPQMARIMDGKCSQCEAWYSSERELYEHRQRAHRAFTSEQSSSQLSGTTPDASTIQEHGQKES